MTRTGAGSPAALFVESARITAVGAEAASRKPV